jgi:hypothetical protein
MIKFFRKIRRNLLSEGKTGKYLKYAFGEIVLVVIGILIALSINNWNECKKAQAQERSSIIEVIENLNYDIIRCENNIASNIKLIQGLDSLRASVGNTIDGSDDTIDIYYYTLKNKIDFGEAALNRSAYDQLIASGNVKLIKNRTLVFNLSDYYERIATSVIDAAPNNGLSNIQNMQKKIISYKGMEGYIQSFDSINPVNFSVDYNYKNIQKMKGLKLLNTNMASLNEYYNEITQFEIDLKTYNFYMSWVKKSAKKLIQEIKTEYQIK